MADNSNTNLFANSSSLDKMVRIVKSQAKESSLNASDQIPDGGYVVVVSYGDTKYVKITDGKNTFSDLPDIGGGGEGVWGSITGDIEDQTDLVNYIQSIPPLPKNGLYVNEENEIQIGNLPLDNSGNGDIIQDTFLKAVSESPEGSHKYGIIYQLGSTQSETVGLTSSFLTEGVAIVSNMGVKAAFFHNLISSPVGDIEIAANLFVHPIKIRDSRFNTGIIYDDDYSEQGASNDRWIPDWGSVKDYVDSATGDDPVTWETIEGKPAFVAEGVDAGAARTALGLGTAATTPASSYATSAQGSKADTALQPGYLESISGYDAGASQTLKNNSGTLEWVTD